jgi:16S rRNA (uracil1498-N3)-methyltransferase
MDFIIQKTIELGVAKIVPVITEHTVVRLDQEKDAARKTVRWQRIALEAAKQCNRGIVPEVSEPLA